MKDKVNMHFQSRKRSVKGVVGFWMSIVSVLFVILLCTLSVMKNGAAGIILGFLGVFVFVFSGFSFSLSLRGLKERDVFTKLPMAGLIISGMVLVFLFILYILGIPW